MLPKYVLGASAALALALAFAPPCVQAQNIKASLGGVVLDSSQSVVPGASVAIRDIGRGVERRAVSNDAGRFFVPALEPGRYQVVVELDGFARYESTEFDLLLGAAPELRIEIAPAGETVSIEVVAAAPAMLQDTDVKLARTFDSGEMNDLPNRPGGTGRNFYVQALTTPGVNYSPLAHRPFAVSGQRPRNNNYMLDSVGINDVESGFIAGRGATEQVVSQEAIESMEVLTHNFRAEYGRNSGSIVNLISRSGTNEFHGSGYWYHNNSALRARNFFEADKTSTRSNLAGFTLGGPIAKNRAFFFSNFETFKTRGEDLSVIRSLTAEQRARAVPSVRPLVDLYPVPTGASSIVPTRNPRSNDQYTYLLRGDIRLTDRQTLHLRDNMTTNTSLLQNISGWVGHKVNTERTTHSATAHHTFAATPTAVNEFRASFMRFAQFDNFIDPITIGDPAINGEVGFLIVPGLSNGGSIGFMGRQQPLNVFGASNDFSLVRGTHSLKIGSSWRYTQANGGLLNNAFAGTLFFPNVNEFLAGRPLSYTRVIGNPLLGLRRTEWDAYIQNTWRATSNLTLDFGLRYELYTSPTEQYDRIDEQFRFPADRNNFAPRAGLAYKLNERTVARAGWGLFYNALELSFIGMTRFNPPQLTTLSAFRPQLPNLLARATEAVPSGFVIPDPGVRTPYAQHWNVSLDRQLWSERSVLNVAYVGTTGTRLQRTRQPNGGENLAQNLRPDPTRGLVNSLETSGSSSYHALQVGLNQRLSTLSMKAAYTYSRYLDEVSEFATGNTRIERTILPLDESNLRLDRGVSDFHIPHIFAASAIWQTPWAKGHRLLGGWSLSSIATLQAGRPYTLYTGGLNPWGVDNNRVYDVPDTLVRNPAAAHAVTLANGLSTANAITPWPGAVGSIGRNTEVGDSLLNWNFGLIKDVPVNERLKVQARAELFNVFNTTNFATIDNVLSLSRDAATGAATGFNPNFGRYTTAFDPRSLQLTLRLAF